jgi:Yip1 domain
MATTTIAAPDPAPEPQQRVSSFGRIFGVLFSPKSTFEDIVQKPSWIAPSAVLVVLSMVASVIFVQRVDWRDVISQQIDKDPRAAQLSAEQKEQRAEMGAKFAPVFGYVGGIVFPILLLLFSCLAMWGGYSLLGGISPGFGRSFAITAHAFMTSLISTPVFLLVVFLKPKGTIDIENPVATNIAAFLPEGTSKALMTLCKQIDVFTIWTLILLAIGFAVVNPRKLKLGSSIGIAFGVWAVFVLCRTGWAFIFS